MSTPRKKSATRSSIPAAGSKNLHCQSVLRHELELIEKEKEHQLHSINHDVNQFRQHASHKPTSAAHGSSPPPPESRTTSRAHSAKSPRSSPLLSHRKSSATGRRSPEVHRVQAERERLLVIEKGSGKLVSVNVPQDKDASPHLPQIIVSDEGDHPRDRPSLQRRGSKHRSPNSRGTDSPARSGSADGSDTGSPLSQSLNLPHSRLRSNSMPSKPPPMNRRPSIDQSSPSSSLHEPDNSRNRSSSFSGIQPARRRGSILEQWGSISERNRPTMGSFKGRRGSVDMENLLRDLSFGVAHGELMSASDKRSTVSDEKWEELRKCRYLRMPGGSGDSSLEDVSQH